MASLTLRIVLTLVVVLALSLPLLATEASAEAQAPGTAAVNATANQTKPQDECRRNKIWNGTACVPGCKGWKYLDDGVCRHGIWQVWAWTQLGLCLWATYAAFFLLSEANSVLRVPLLCGIGFALFTNNATMPLLEMVWGWLLVAGRYAAYATLEALIVFGWFVVDFVGFIYPLMWFPPEAVVIYKSVRAQKARLWTLVRGNLWYMKTVLLVPLVLWWRGPEALRGLLHVSPAILMAARIAPLLDALIRDPGTPEQMRENLRLIGTDLQATAAVAVGFLTPVVAIVAHFFPMPLSVTLEAITLGFSWHFITGYYRALSTAQWEVTPAPRPPVALAAAVPTPSHPEVDPDGK